MWRYLTGLNEADLKQELQAFEANFPESIQLDNLIQHSFIKAIGIDETRLHLIRKHLKRFKEIAVFSKKNNLGKTNLLFSIPPTSLKRFAKIIESETVDELMELSQLLENIFTDRWHFQLRDKELKIDGPLIMGILNVTPDSFSDGGSYYDEDSAYKHGIEMLEAGTDIIDIGGESTRPGSTPVSLEEEWQRIGDVINRIQKNQECVISVDTYKSEIARRALDLGAHIINDISGLTFDLNLAAVVAKHEVPIILMHIKGTPRDMQKRPSYQNLLDEIYFFLHRQCQFAKENGIHQIIVDPGVGFGKRPRDNFELIRRIGEFRGLGYPVLLGASRKSFIGFGLNDPQRDRMPGSLSSAILGILRGANIIRVHDVEETKQALQLVHGVRNFKEIY